jgi:hypothetical protein
MVSLHDRVTSYIGDVRFLLIPVLAVLSYGRTPAKTDTIDLSQGVKLESNLPCDGATNPQQEIILQTHFSAAVGQLSFLIDNYQDETCKADIGITCFKHVPAGWQDDLRIDSDGSAHYWLNSCRTWGSKDVAQYSLTSWYKETAVKKKKQPWKQLSLKQVSAQPEVYEFTAPNGGTGRIEITRR